MKKFKKRKWYLANKYTPDVNTGLIIQTDMGWIFEAIIDNDGMWKTSVIIGDKVYFEPVFNKESIWRWMKI